MLEVIDLELKYGSYSKSLNFKLEPGTLSWLRGKNGAGKSTLVKALAGVLQPIGGEIQIAGNLRLAYLPQQAEIDRRYAQVEAALDDWNNRNREGGC